METSTETSAEAGVRKAKAPEAGVDKAKAAKPGAKEATSKTAVPTTAKSDGDSCGPSPS